MPIFDYTCTHCGYSEDDVLVKSADTQLPCPDCANPLSRKTSLANFAKTANGGVRFKKLSR